MHKFICLCPARVCAGLTAEVITPQLRDQLGKLKSRGKVQGLGAGGAAGGDLVSGGVTGYWRGGGLESLR